MKSIAIVAAASVLFAPGVSLAQKGEARPDFNLDPNYGTVDLGRVRARSLHQGHTRRRLDPGLSRQVRLRGQCQRRARFSGYL